jgi:YidC/Oxa1 family membrane protein insertase
MKMQRIMMTWLMPIMLTWLFFFSAPSGLVLYWMVSNMVGVLIQLWINRKTADLTAEIAAASTGGGGSKSAAPRAADKPGTPKRPKDKSGKRRQEGRGGAEEVA